MQAQGGRVCHAAAYPRLESFRPPVVAAFEPGYEGVPGSATRETTDDKTDNERDCRVDHLLERRTHRWEQLPLPRQPLVGTEQQRNYSAIGDAVNYAKRLQENAKGGQILISRPAYRQVEDFVRVIELPPLQVKGRSTPEIVYEVVGLKDRVP